MHTCTEEASISSGSIHMWNHPGLITVQGHDIGIAFDANHGTEGNGGCMI
jgi:hypothetical protein